MPKTAAAPKPKDDKKFTVRLPEGYTDPAFQLPDGRTLYVARYLIQTQWATLFMTEQGGLDRFDSPSTPIMPSKSQALAKLLAYAKEKGLTRIQ